jgi:hypothetical protein
MPIALPRQGERSEAIPLAEIEAQFGKLGSAEAWIASLRSQCRT